METNQTKELATTNLMLGIRSYTRTELAMMYMPHLSRSTALKNFNSWLSQNKRLQADLLLAGATTRTRRYTPRQIKLIFEAFDTP